MVHEIDLGQDTNSPPSQGVHIAGKLQGLRVDNVYIGGRDGENDTVRLGDEFRNKVAGLLFDVCGLVTDGDL